MRRNMLTGLESIELLPDPTGRIDIQDQDVLPDSGLDNWN